MINDYITNFFQHSGQVSSFLAAAALWLGFALIGGYFVGDGKVREAAPFYGWAVVSFVFTLVGVFFNGTFPWLALTTGILIALLAIIYVKRNGLRLTPGIWRIFILAAPLIVLVSAMVGSQWDEFSDWLISPRLMLETGSFPNHLDMGRAGTLAAYPYGWHYITYLISLPFGRLVENAGALINIFMLLTFALTSVRLIKAGAGRGDEPVSPGWALAAVGALSTTLLNPTFAQKVVLTSYADTATATVAGLGGVIGWLMLGALAEGRRKQAIGYAMQVGLLMMLLVNLKQSTVVLAILVLGGVLLAGWRDPKIGLRGLVPTLPYMTVPAIIIFLAWRYYVGHEMPGGEMQLRGFSGWLIGDIPQILLRMLLVLSKKGVYLLLFVLIVGFGLRGLIRYRTPFDRLAIIVAAVFLGHNAFLLFAYVTTFGKFEALRAASFWRYNMQLGLLGVAFSAYGLGLLWKKYAADRSWPAKAGWLPVALILIAPLVFANKLRFDRQPPAPYFRAIGAQMNTLLKAGDRLLVIDPKGTGQSGVITRFEMGGQGIYKGFISAFYNMTAEKYRQKLSGGAFSYLLVHSFNEALLRVLKLKLVAGRSYLLKADGDGWRIVRSWNRP